MLGISGVVSYLSYQNYHLRQEKESLKAEIAETKSVFTSQKEELLENIEAFKVILAANQSDKNNLEQDLLTEREAVDAIEAQVQAMTGTVGTLKKLSETDKELLKKYSRVYFLNENYIPKYLFPILRNMSTNRKKRNTYPLKYGHFSKKCWMMRTPRELI